MIVNTARLETWLRAAGRQPAPSALEAEGPLDQVRLNDAQVVASPARPPQERLQALQRIAQRVGSEAIPSPVLRAVLTMAQDESHPELQQQARERLDRWKESQKLRFCHGTMEDLVGGADYALVSQNVHFHPPAVGPDAGLVAAVEAGNEREVWSALHKASRSELDRCRDYLASSTSSGAVNSYGAADRQGMLLFNYPELITPEQLEKELLPIVTDDGSAGARDAMQVIAENYGPEAALREAMKRPQVLQYTLPVIQTYVDYANFKPDAESVRTAVDLAADSAGSYDRHGSNLPALLHFLARVHRDQPLEMAERGRLRDALLSHSDPGWAIYAALYYDEAAPLMVGHPDLVAPVLERLHEPAAVALAMKADLNEEQWARLRLAVDMVPRVDKYRHIHGDFPKLDLRRKLEGMPAEQAVAGVEELARGRVESGEAHRQVFHRILGDLQTDGAPTLSAMSYHDALPFFKVVEDAVRGGYLARRVEELETQLRELGRGLVGGHQEAVAALADMAGSGPMQPLVERYWKVCRMAGLHHGSVGTGREARNLMELAGDSEERLKAVTDWYASVHRSLDVRGWELAQSLRSVPTKLLDRALPLLNGPANSAAGVEFLTDPNMTPGQQEGHFRLAEGVKGFAAAAALRSPVASVVERQGPDIVPAALEVVSRLSDSLPEKDRLPAILAALEELALSGSAQAALQSGLMKATGVSPKGPGGSVQIQPDSVRVGNVSLRVRKRNP